MTRDVVERYLHDFVCAKKVLWLKTKGLAGDDTDGHIDQLARFVGPTKIVAAACDDANDENFYPLKENIQQLQRMTNQDGTSLEIMPLPLPQAIYFEGQRLPTSYCNFYIANSVVIVPAFDDVADDVAATTLADCFPGREIVLLPATDLAWGLGAFHCLSQQQPKPRERNSTS
jgi:agmatine deiminase